MIGAPTQRKLCSLTRALLSEHGHVADSGRLRDVIDQGRTLARALEGRLADAAVPIDNFLKHGVGPPGSTYSLRGPRWRHQEDHELAALGRLLEDILPALAGLETALGVQVQEQLVPALINQPIVDGDGLGVIGRRMAQKNT